MNVDERLRNALHDEVADVEPAPDGWSGIATGVRRARRRRRAGAAIVAVAAVVAALIALPPLLDRDDAHVETTPAHEGTATTTTTTESTTTSAPYPGVWPFTSRAEVDAYKANPGVGMFFDPEATALEFARAYLGMPDPQRDSVSRHEDDSVTVVVRPKPTSPVETRIDVVGGPAGPYSVAMASTEHIRPEEPAWNADIASPVRVSGTSIAFEAVVHVEVREDGQAFGQSLGASTVMGGGTEMAPFQGDIAFDRPTKPSGVIVFFTDSAEDGSIVEATIVRVHFGDASR